MLARSNKSASYSSTPDARVLALEHHQGEIELNRSLLDPVGLEREPTERGAQSLLPEDDGGQIPGARQVAALPGPNMVWNSGDWPAVRSGAAAARPGRERNLLVVERLEHRRARRREQRRNPDHPTTRTATRERVDEVTHRPRKSAEARSRRECRRPAPRRQCGGGATLEAVSSTRNGVVPSRWASCLSAAVNAESNSNRTSPPRRACAPVRGKSVSSWRIPGSGARSFRRHHSRLLAPSALPRARVPPRQGGVRATTGGSAPSGRRSSAADRACRARRARPRTTRSRHRMVRGEQQQVAAIRFAKHPRAEQRPVLGMEKGTGGTPPRRPTPSAAPRSRRSRR